MRSLLSIGILALTFNMSSFAADPVAKGNEIATKMEDARRGFVGEASKMQMFLLDAHGGKTIRSLDGKVMEIAGDGDKSLSIFLEPLDVKGTKMLTWSHKEDDDDQWIYLPALRRVKRITSSGKSASFMGSEFSYEDLGSQEKEKYTFTLLREEKGKNGDVWVLERIPKKKSSYSKQILWVLKDKLLPEKIEYYNRRKELFKVAVSSGFQTYTVAGKKLHRASRIQMDNLLTKKSSSIVWKERKMGVKFKDREFSKRGLK